MSAVAFAKEVLAMQERIQDLELQVCRLAEYERLYNDLLHESVDHNRAMVGNLFVLGMKLVAEKDGAS